MKYPMVSARLLVGRRIVGFEPRPFPNGRGGVAHSPRMILDDGSTLVFDVESTQVPGGSGLYDQAYPGEYGIFIQRVAGKRKRGRTRKVAGQ